MDDRVYIVLDLVDNKPEQLSHVLQTNPAVFMGDVVDRLLTQSNRSNRRK